MARWHRTRQGGLEQIGFAVLGLRTLLAYRQEQGYMWIRGTEKGKSATDYTCTYSTGCTVHQQALLVARRRPVYLKDVHCTSTSLYSGVNQFFLLF
jgi:hypothetical protein